MIFLTKLILAHLIGDFVLQPKSWVNEKEQAKGTSSKLYLHVLIHGILILVVFADMNLWPLALAVSIIHLVIDMAKLYLQSEYNKARAFVVDQILHLTSLAGIWFIWKKPTVNFTEITENAAVWIYVTAVLFLSVVTGIIIRMIMARWSANISGHNSESLDNAGKYIGVLERLLIFIFIINGRWEAVGFLLAAKSVFRFGDLKESKDRKLTEYILIGTLLSFGTAICITLLVLHLTDITYTL